MCFFEKEFYFINSIFLRIKKLLIFHTVFCFLFFSLCFYCKAVGNLPNANFKTQQTLYSWVPNQRNTFYLCWLEQELQFLTELWKTVKLFFITFHMDPLYMHVLPSSATDSSFTVGKRNYFTVCGILLHGLPVVAVLLSQSN